MKKYIKSQIRLILILFVVSGIFLSACDGEDFLHLPDPIEPITVTSISDNEGEIGDEISITGTNFSLLASNNKVRFGEVLAEVKSATKTELEVLVPNAVPLGELSTTVQLTVSHSKFSVNAGEFTISKPVVTLVVPLSDANDDVEEVAVIDANPDTGIVVGSMILDSSDLEIGEVSSGEGLMNIGIRYQNVMIPVGSIISEAYIQFNADDVGSNPVELTIYGEDVGDAEAYTTDAGNLSARELTTATIVWNIPEWIDSGDRGDAQRTVNIASILQEIVNREDWESGNSINIIMKPTGATLTVTSTSGGRESEDYSSSDSNHGAELTVIYQ